MGLHRRSNMMSNLVLTGLGLALLCGVFALMDNMSKWDWVLAVSFAALGINVLFF